MKKLIQSFEAVPDWIRAAETQSNLEYLLYKKISFQDIPLILSPRSDSLLESLSQKAHKLTKMKFGRTIQLYAPVYLSNECSNGCKYCGFSANNSIPRKTLSLSEIKLEYQRIHESGIRHILLLTGDSPRSASVDYLCSAIQLAKDYFCSVSLEVFPMSSEEYRQLIRAGTDGLTLYQETYDRDVYESVHTGSKRDYFHRLAAINHAGDAGMRRIGLGALLGLSNPVFDLTALSLHLSYLKRKYWRTYFTVSFPRFQQAQGGIKPLYDIDDRLFVKMIIAIRLLFDDVGIVISTRERASFRDNLIPLGVTQMSAGSKTEPAGYTQPGQALKQFEISDTRSPLEVSHAIAKMNYEPVWKDWQQEMI